MISNKHIAMWSCPRSRTTAITRAFERLPGCAIFDTPFFGAYLTITETPVDRFDRSEIDSFWEKDYEAVIARMTGDLPDGVAFSFQRHISRTVLPEFGRDWLKSLHNFVLVRDPSEIILSYQRVLDKYGIADQHQLTMHDIGIDRLYNLMIDIETVTGRKPLVIHSDDLARDPALVLSFLCDQFGIEFDEQMLTWEPGLQNSEIAGPSLAKAAETWSQTWYDTVAKSTGFLPFEKKQEVVPEHLRPLLDACSPYYAKLTQLCMRYETSS